MSPLNPDDPILMRVVATSNDELERFTLERQRRLFSVFDRERDALLTKIARLGDTNDTFSARQLRVALTALDDARKRLAKDLERELGATWREAGGMAGAQALNELSTLEGAYGSTSAARGIAALAGVVPNRAIARVDELSALELEALGGELDAATRLTLQRGLLQGLSSRELVPLLAQQLGDAWTGKRWQLERTLRQGLHAVMNQGHHETYIEARDELLPELQRAGHEFLMTPTMASRASRKAGFRRVNHPFSKHLEGAVTPLDKPWVIASPEYPVMFWARTPGGYTGMHYPAHMWERGREVPWHPAWEGNRASAAARATTRVDLGAPPIEPPKPVVPVVPVVPPKPKVARKRKPKPVVPEVQPPEPVAPPRAKRGPLRGKGKRVSGAEVRARLEALPDRQAEHRAFLKKKADDYLEQWHNLKPELDAIQQRIGVLDDERLSSRFKGVLFDKHEEFDALVKQDDALYHKRLRLLSAHYKTLHRLERLDDMLSNQHLRMLFHPKASKLKTKITEKPTKGQWGHIDEKEAINAINDAIKDFKSLIGPKLLDKRKVDVIIRPNVRAHAPMDSIVLSSSGNKVTVVHELGHHLEFFGEKVYEKSQAFLDRRTMGEQEQKLRDVSGNLWYRDDEIVKPDQFENPYVGKIYGKYDKYSQAKLIDKVVADNPTEVVSMGVQFMYQDARAFAKRDPDYFDVIWDIITEGD